MTSAEKCCGQCFGDRGLEHSIIPSLSDEEGACPRCLAADVALVLPSVLAEHFGLLVNTYEPSESGRSLLDWVKSDWDMFHHPRMDDGRATLLLRQVLGDADVVGAAFVPSARYQSDKLDRWTKLREELMYENRYFPAARIDDDRLGQLFGHLPAVGMPTTWFRARLHPDGELWSIEEMGAPPNRKARAGRANPPGIPYLYLASTLVTAVSEIRPHAGETACVADFTISPDIKVVDLRSPRRLVSPFVLESEDEIGLLRSDIAFLERLGEELTRPVMSEGASIDYVPSQYLCEFIKQCGYKGVLYRSSVGEGMNLSLFEPAIATPGAVVQYRVSTVTVDVTSM